MILNLYIDGAKHWYMKKYFGIKNEKKNGMDEKYKLRNGKVYKKNLI